MSCSLCPTMLISPKEQSASSTPTPELLAALRSSPCFPQQGALGNKGWPSSCGPGWGWDLQLLDHG